MCEYGKRSSKQSIIKSTRQVVYDVSRLGSRESHQRVELKRDKYTRFGEVEHDAICSEVDVQLDRFLPAAEASLLEENQLFEVVTVHYERQDEGRIRVAEVTEQTQVVCAQIPAELVRRVRGHLDRVAIHENRRCG